MRVAALRHRLRPHEIPAAIRALLDEKKLSLNGLRERRKALQHGAKLARLARAPPPRLH